MEPVSIKSLGLKREPAKCGCLIEPKHQIAVGLGNGQIDCLPLEPQVQVQRLRGHKEQVTGLVYDIRNQMLISSSLDSTIRLWNDDSSTVINTSNGPIKGMAAPEDVKFVLIFNDAGNPSLWDVIRQESTGFLPSHALPTCSAAVSADGNMCATTMEDGNVRIFDSRSNRQIASFKSVDVPSSVAINAQQGTVGVGCHGGFISLYDIRAGEILAEQKLHDGNVTSIDFHPYRNVYLSGSQDSTISVGGSTQLSPVFTISAHKDSINQVKWSDNGDTFFSLGEDKYINLWRIPEEDVSDSDIPVEYSESEIFEETPLEFSVKQPLPESESEEEHDDSLSPDQLDQLYLLRHMVTSLDDLENVVQKLQTRLQKMESDVVKIEEAQEEAGSLVKQEVPLKG